MQLRQPESLRVLDHHQRGVRHVDADLDDRRRDQDLQLPGGEAMHHRFLLVALHPAVQQRDGELGKHLRDLLRHRGRGLEIDLLRLLDERIDHVDLPAAADLVAHHRVDLVAPRIGLDHRLDRLAAGRQAANHRHFHVAAFGQRQRARNRRRGHDEHVGIRSFRGERAALHDAEAMLLVDHARAPAP